MPTWFCHVDRVSIALMYYFLYYFSCFLSIYVCLLFLVNPWPVFSTISTISKAYPFVMDSPSCNVRRYCSATTFFSFHLLCYHYLWLYLHLSLQPKTNSKTNFGQHQQTMSCWSVFGQQKKYPLNHLKHHKTITFLLKCRLLFGNLLHFSYFLFSINNFVCLFFP